MLAEAAAAAGVDWRYGHRLLTASRPGGRWRLAVSTPAGRGKLSADFVVDASGRAARLARQLGVRRVRYDRLIGVSAVLAAGRRGGAPAAGDSFTQVEAVAGGWWYSARLSGGRLAVAFMTDSDLLAPAVRRPAGWWALLAATELTRARVAEHRGRAAAAAVRPAAATRLRILAADSARLTAIMDPEQGWLAAGDAAAAFDPLSSHGIGTAMGAGFYGAHAIADTLAGRADAHLAYLALMERAYGDYAELHRLHYAGETRWPDEPFWRRRHSPDFFSPARGSLPAAEPRAGRP